MIDDATLARIITPGPFRPRALLRPHQFRALFRVNELGELFLSGFEVRLQPARERLELRRAAAQCAQGAL